MELTRSFHPVLVNRFLRRYITQHLETYITYTARIIVYSSIFLASFFIARFTLDTVTTSVSLQKSLIEVQKKSSSSSSTFKKPPPETKYFVQRAMFGSLEKPKTSNTTNVAPPKPKASLALIGVFMAGDVADHYAIIEDSKKNNQDVFSVSESIFGEATLEKIMSDEVVVKYATGETETLVIDESGGGGSSGASGVPIETLAVNKKELDDALSNLPLLLTQARAVPYFKDGKSIGLRLFAIKGGSMFEKIGLKNGDILKNINGSSLSDITQAVKLFDQLKDQTNISVIVERNREEKNLQYQIR